MLLNSCSTPVCKHVVVVAPICNISLSFFLSFFFISFSLSFSLSVHPSIIFCQAGPGLFGLNLDDSPTTYHGSVVLAAPETLCVSPTPHAYRGRFVFVRRGGCMFVNKVTVGFVCGCEEEFRKS